MIGAPPPLFRRRALGRLLCIAAAAALTFSLATRSWWTHRVHHDTSIDVGPWSARVCVGDYSVRYLDGAHAPPAPDSHSERWTACTDQKPGEVAEHLAANRDQFIIDDVWGSTGDIRDRRFTILGVVVLGVGLGALLALVGVAVAAAGARARRWQWLAHIAAGASGAFLVLAVLFAVAAPAEIDQMSLDLGFTLALAGGGLGIAAGRLLAAPDDGWRPLPRSAHFWRAVALLSAGVVAAALGLHTRTWWVEDDDSYQARHGVRDGESCEGEEHGCEIETWNSQPEGATGKRPVKRLVAFRASEVAYQLGHLAILVALLLLFLLLQGQRVEGRWAPHRILLVTATGFLVAAVVLAVGDRPDWIDDRASLSIGPVLALAGGVLFLWGAIAVARLGREPPPASPLPRARVHDG